VILKLINIISLCTNHFLAFPMPSSIGHLAFWHLLPGLPQNQFRPQLYLAFVVDFSEAPQTAIATRSGTVPQSHSCAHFLAHFIGQGRSPSNGRRPSAAPPCPSHFMPFWPVLFLDQTPLEISVSVPCLWTCQWLPQLSLGLDYLCNW